MAGSPMVFMPSTKSTGADGMSWGFHRIWFGSVLSLPKSEQMPAWAYGFRAE